MYTHLNNWLQEAINQSKTANHRSLLVMSGDRKNCWKLLRELLCDSAFQEIRAFQAIENCALNCLQINRASDFLGTNNNCVIFDAWGGFDPDAFGIVSGSVSGGGLVILLTPSLSGWPQFSDPVNKRLAVHPLKATDIKGNYLKRISRIMVDQLPPPETVNNVECRLLVTQSVSLASPQALPNSEQSQLIACVVKLVSSPNAKNPIVVTSDRGRGKSTALGLAAAKLLKSGLVAKIIVTAPGKPALHSFFKAAESRLGVNEHKSPLFVAADVLVRDLPEAELLIIDEAAAIPLPIILKLIAAYPLCILSSTLHGYEGSGRGFALRLRKLLDQHHKKWQRIPLTLAVRFANNDPLEKFTADLLMLNATMVGNEKKTVIRHADCQLIEIHSDELVTNEQLLNELFALLLQAHYQTKPLDLKHILDGSNLRIFSLVTKNKIVAAALLANEQIADDHDLQNAIIHGERRPRGHLLSQQLAYQNIEKKFLDLKLARIVRIAVLPALQSRSLGSLLLDKLLVYCAADQVDAIGASFGATTELLKFWHKSHYQTLHLGYKRNASSAAYSAVVLRHLSAQARILSAKSFENFSCNLHFRKNLADGLPFEDHTLLAGSNISPVADTSFTIAVVSSYAYRHRDFESSHAQLYRYLRYINLANAKISTLQKQLLVSIILQCKNWKPVSKELKLQGRKHCETLMRSALQKISPQI